MSSLIFTSNGGACADDPLCLDGEFTIDFWIKLSTDTRYFGAPINSNIKATEILQANPGGSGEAGSVLQISYMDRAHQVWTSLGWPPGDSVISVRTEGMSNAYIYDIGGGPSGEVDDVWHHVALTRDSDNEIRFFWNGVLKIAYNEGGGNIGTSYTNTNTLDINGAGGLKTVWTVPF